MVLCLPKRGWPPAGPEASPMEEGDWNWRGLAQQFRPDGFGRRSFELPLLEGVGLSLLHRLCQTGEGGRLSLPFIT